MKHAVSSEARSPNSRSKPPCSMNTHMCIHTYTMKERKQGRKGRGKRRARKEEERGREGGKDRDSQRSRKGEERQIQIS